MHHILLVGLAAALATAPRGAAAQPDLAARSNACASTPAEAEEQLRRLEDDWNRAGTARDGAFFERLLADDFVATGGRTVRSRADYIAGIRDTADGARTLATLSETRVRVYGDVAVVTGVASYDETPPRRRRYTEVFVCRDGRWQAVHGHYSDIPTPVDTAAARATPPDTIFEAAAREQRAGRGPATRAVLERGLRAATADRRLLYQGTIGDSHLYDGDLERARAAYGALLRSATATRNDSMANFGHYGLALVDALAGRAAVLDRPPAEPFAWYYLIARHVARQVR